MKSTIVLFLLITFYFTSIAQQDVFSSLEFGLSINHASGTIDANKIGFGLSIRKIWFNDKNLNLISGLLFDKTKYFEESMNSGTNCSYRNMNFSRYLFSIPVLGRLNLGKRVVFFCQAGPTLEIVPLKWGKGIQSTYFPLTATTDVKNISGDFEHNYLNLNIHSGIGLAFPVSKIKLITSVSYNKLIVPIISHGFDEQNDFISLILGISIK